MTAMKKFIMVFSALLTLVLCAAVAGKIRDRQAQKKVIWKNFIKYKDFNGTPENTVIFYGGFHGTGNDFLFRQVDPECDPDTQALGDEEYFVSKPVRLGTRYVLEYWYWTDGTETTEGSSLARDYDERTSPLVIDIPFEPGFYYFGYYDGRASIVNGELMEWDSHPSAEMKPAALREVLKRYAGTSWAPLIKEELKVAEAEAKQHKAERKARRKADRKKK